MKQKKALADTDKILFWLIFVLPTILLMMTLIVIVLPDIIDSQTQISKGLERKIYKSILTGSPLCFAYEDHMTGRTHNGIIDINKLNDQTLNDCLRLTQITEQGFFIVVYKEGEFFRELETQNALRKVSGKSIEQYLPVIIRENDKQYNGVLKFIFY